MNTSDIVLENYDKVVDLLNIICNKLDIDRVDIGSCIRRTYDGHMHIDFSDILYDIVSELDDVKYDLFLAWPQFEDGSYVRFGDKFLDGNNNVRVVKSIRVEPVKDNDNTLVGADCYIYWGDSEFESILVCCWEGDTVKKPDDRTDNNIKFVDSDGIPIHCGDCVRYISDEIDCMNLTVTGKVYDSNQVICTTCTDLDSPQRQYRYDCNELTHFIYHSNDSYKKLMKKFNKIKSDIGLYKYFYKNCCVKNPEEYSRESIYLACCSDISRRLLRVKQEVDSDNI